MSISACWITKNAAAELARSIDSVRACATETIVVDTGSTDDTVRIAKEHGAQVAHFQWQNDFSAARNFCLSLAHEDYVIFLDADEYFERTLSPNDADKFIRVFEESQSDLLLIPMLNVDSGFHFPLFVGRIFKRTAIHYENQIHEIQMLKNGETPSCTSLAEYMLIHTGYSKSRISEKLKRNIFCLEAELETLSNPKKIFSNHAYLMREYLSQGDYEKSYEHCRFLLDHDTAFDLIPKEFACPVLDCFYQILDLALKYRHKFCRREIYHKVIIRMTQYDLKSLENLIASLYYQLLFEYQEETFLKELSQIEPRIDQQPPLVPNYSFAVLSLIYSKAAIAFYYRGNMKQAVDYATKGLMNPAAVLNPMAVQIVLRYRNDISADSIHSFLDQLITNLDSAGLEQLFRILMTEQNRHLFSYYKDNIKPNYEWLSNWTAILETYLKQGTLLTPSKSDLTVLHHYYSAIRFFTNDELSETFRQLFLNSPADMFIVKASYLMDNLDFTNVLNDPGSVHALTDIRCAYYVIQSSLILKEYQMAYDLIMRYKHRAWLDNQLIHFLLIIAEGADHILAQKARKHFELSLRLMNEAIDFIDEAHQEEAYDYD